MWLPYTDSQDLIANILRMEPRDRLNIRQILGHDWFIRAPPVFSPSLNDYFQHGEFLHQVIPEESTTNSPISILPLPTMLQESEKSKSSHLEEPSTTESIASTASWHSAASTTESDASLSAETARTDTPLTSDEAGAHDSSDNTAGDYMSAGQSTSENASSKHRSIPRHASQATITRSNSRHSIGHHFRPSPLLSGADSTNQLHRFPSPTPGIGDSTVPPGSPTLHMQAHSRTPSRTKRRSIGSTMSERLTFQQEQSLPDFVTLLDHSSPQLFSSNGDKALLESLGMLGIDTGQMIHSVRNNACDSSSAIWWMLKSKADQREQEALDIASHAPAKSESMSSIAPSIHQIPRAKTNVNGSAIEELNAFRLSSENTPEVNVDAPADESQEAMEVLQYGEQNHSESPRKQRIQVPGSARASISAPLLVTRPEASATVVQNKSTETLNMFVSASPSRTSAGAGRRTSSSREVPKAGRSPTNKPRSASVSTVSMLQRATTALGVRKEKPEDRNSVMPAGEGGRSTPSLLTAGFFARKVSSSSVTPERPSPELQKESKSDDFISAGPTRDYSNANENSKKSPRSSPPLSSTPELVHAHLSTSSPGAASTLSRDTQDSLGSYSLPSGSSEFLQALSTGSHNEASGTGSHKARGSKNIFSTFKMWFNEEKRKSRHHRPASTIAGNSPSRTAGGSVRKPYMHAPSPLQRPPIARMPSNTPSSAAISRRNSTTSARHLNLNDQSSPLLGYHNGRRRSDASRHSFGSANGARTPTSERGHSRPPSAQSGAPASLDTFNMNRKRHARAGSSSSAGSRHSTMINGSPVATYRRTPAVTQVRRISTPKNRYSHSRNASNNSSAHSASSHRSSLSVPMEGEETIMEEENENLDESVELERTKALRKLSGDQGVPATAPHALTAAAVAAVDAMSEQLAVDPEPQRRGSSEHSHGRHHRRHHSSSSAHGSTVFAAHKVVNPFGTPNGSHFTANSHGRSKRETEKPKLRDIFKKKIGDGEDGWIDEEEGVYSGGFGQASSRPTLMTTGSDGMPTIHRTASYTPQAEDVGTPNLRMLGEGRYAGVNRTECAAPSFGGPRPRQTAKGPSFKQAATVVEEEEEEEE